MAMTLSGGGGGVGGGGGMGLVLVEFEYEYTGRDGSLVCIKPHERYLLLAKTNDHWWHVRRDQRSRPFYIPAKYVKELPNAFPSPLDFTPPSPPPQPAVVGVGAGSGPPGAVVSVVSPTPPSPEPKMAPSAAQDLAQEKRAGDEVTIRVKSPNRYRKTENRMSTFGVPLDMMHVDPPVAQAATFKRAQTEPAFSIAALAGGGGGGGGAGTQEHAPSSSSSSSSSSQKKRLSFFGGGSRGSNTTSPAPAAVVVPVVPAMEDLSHKRVPSFSPADPVPRPVQGKPVDLPIIKALSGEVPLREEESPEPVSPLEPDSESASSTEPDRSPDSENIYESILDLNLNLDGSPVSETAPALIPAPALPESASAHTCLPVPPAVPPHGKADNENPTTAVYANVTDVKRATPRAPTTTNATSSSTSSPASSSSTQRPLSGGEGWEVHTDKDSGKDFYYQPSTGQSRWEDPRSPTTAPAAAGASMDSLASPLSTSSLNSPCASTSSSRGSDWEQLLDETTGRHYYYNPISGQTSWAAPEVASPASPLSPSTPPAAESHILQRQHSDGPPPLPEEDYPTEEPETPVFTRDVPFAPVKRAPVPRPTLEPSVPAGWTRSQQPDGKTLFTTERTQEQWLQSKDEKGRTYYYLRDGSKSQWNLPELSAAPSSQPAVGNGVDSEGPPVLKNWRHSMAPTIHLPAPADDTRFFPAHRRHVSDNTSDASSSGNSPETPHHDGRVRLRRNLSNSSTDSQMYHGHLLEKAGILNKTKVVDCGKKLRKNWSQSWTVLHGGILTFHRDPKSAPSGPSSKSNQIVPEYTVELRGATIMWAARDKSSKKNVLELKTRNGSEYLIQYDTDSIITDWHKIIVDTIRQLDQDHFSEEDEDDAENDKDRKRSLRSNQSGDPDQGRVRTKLRKFLQRRPTLQAVKEKGYIKDAVFGCHLDTLCHRESTTVPRFVEKCIKAVERRGLDVDGIYRVSGNLAVIQRLRHRADHDDNLDLEDGQWEEIHVITGALKLFLREMPEPLFPFSFFDKFIAAIQISDYAQKVSYMQDLVRSLPLPNHNTMEVLFKHLRRVIESGEANRMSVQSTAIVFGPTLLRPQEESANITIHMVFQNQIVELILNEFEEVFKPR